MLIAAAVATGVYLKSRSAVPVVPFTKVTRETISNVLSTNGKVEPVDYSEIRAESPGLIKRVLVHDGDAVRKGQEVAQLSEPGLLQELDAAIAREAQARADLR